jgi:hypothetical protein
MAKAPGKAKSAAKEFGGPAKPKSQSKPAKRPDAKVLENSEKKQGHRFKPGQSGNPSGKPKGARHRTTLLLEKLMEDDARDIVKVVLDAAKAGDLAAARIVLERVVPARKDSVIRFTLPPIATANDASAAMSSVLSAVAAGEVTPGEAIEVGRLIETFIKTHEISDLENRIAALEGRPHDAHRA